MKSRVSRKPKKRAKRPAFSRKLDNPEESEICSSIASSETSTDETSDMTISAKLDPTISFRQKIVIRTIPMPPPKYNAPGSSADWDSWIAMSYDTSSPYYPSFSK